MFSKKVICRIATVILSTILVFSTFVQTTAFATESPWPPANVTVLPQNSALGPMPRISIGGVKWFSLTPSYYGDYRIYADNPQERNPASIGVYFPNYPWITYINSTTTTFIS